MRTREAAIEQGRAAASRGEWQQAYRLLLEADEDETLAGDDLALLATAAYAAGDLDGTIQAWERAYTRCLRAGDRASAAGAASRVAMHLLVDTGLMVPVRIWIHRAERLLDPREPTPIRAWLAVVRSYERMFSGDFAEARRWSREAIAVGARCDPGAAAVGRIAEARSLIFEGEVRQGLELLDEAALAAVSGELDPLSTGVSYCELVCALQGLAQYDVAEEWTKAMERWRHGHAVGSAHGRCRVHRAEILRLRGFYAEAEQEALRACEELRPYMRREFGWPLTELGTIRLRKGDLAGAEEAFLAAQGVGWDPQPGLALTRLARGDVALAAASIRYALDHPSTAPSKELPPNTELRRAPLLDAQVEIAVQAGDLDRARWAARELAQIAAVFGSNALAASAAAAVAKVRLADGDADGARRGFETALHLWSEIGAPYETALARMGIAGAHRAAGDAECALLELQAARVAFEQVGAAWQAERAAQAAEDLARGGGSGVGGRAPPAPVADVGRARGAPALPEVGTLRREGEYWSLTFDGRTVRVRDVKGMRYLAALVAAPGREIHVLDLVAAERGWTADSDGAAESLGGVASQGDAGAILDTRAKEAYRRRLAEIEEEIITARVVGDIARESQAETERDFLIRELSRAVGLGGRDRRMGSPSERARVSVTRALRSALARIRAHDAPLADHLDRCVRTGTYCAYLPDPRAPVVWQVGGRAEPPRRAYPELRGERQPRAPRDAHPG
jgi:tetratricopeptide (TPR) repeat protein